MNLLELPHELVCKVISFLDPKSAKEFIQIDRHIYLLSKDDYFWANLCRTQGIQYCHPESTWRDLFLSGSLSEMCCHINPKELYSSIPEKREILWTNISGCFNHRDMISQNYVMCLYKNCNYYDLVENYKTHQSNTGHTLSIKVAPLNILEMCCHSCQKTIGFDKFSSNAGYHIKTERRVMNEVTKGLVSMDTEERLYTQIVSNRRKIELGLFKFQMRQFNCHLVEKDWHDKWLNFITGKSDVAPGPLTNKKLVQQDGTLNPSLELGKDFDMVGNLGRWYIECIYGNDDDTLFSINDLESLPEYCKLVHSVKIRHQMIQAARYSFDWMF